MFKFIKRFKYALNTELYPSDLHTILIGLNPQNSFHLRIHALKGLMHWLRQPTKVDLNSSLEPFIQSRNIRFKFFIQYLDRNPKEKQFFTDALKELFQRGIAIRLYCLTGVSENQGFFSELTERVTLKFLPQSLSEKDLAEIFKVMFTDEEDAVWIERSYETIIPPLEKLIEESEASTTPLIEDQRDALIILGAKIASIGSSKRIRRRLRERNLHESSFIRLNILLNNSELVEKDVLNLISACREDLTKVRNTIEETGVSVALIYDIEKLQSFLDRIEILIYLRSENLYEDKKIMISFFIGQLIRDEMKSMGLKDFMNEHLHMLTRKIVERAGEKGEHYIASTPQAKINLFIAASWAGVLTAFTAVIKYFIGAQHLPLFFEGFFFFVNYAASFLLMQFWHLALSSKQPAYTASALSNKFEDFIKTKELHGVILEIRKIAKSQLIASIANLVYVIPVVILLDWAWLLSTGHHIVSQEVAQDILYKHHPFLSASLPYAILTGILLWLSSVIAGWIENWIVFRNIPEILIENSFFNSFFGKEKTKKMAGSLSNVVGGVAGNISIAFFMATPIIIGKMTGLPIDIRHVTLATGTVTLALNSLNWDLSLWPWFLYMALSIACIGLLNFGVSFYCSIRVAALARNVKSRYLGIIFKFAFWHR